MGFSVRFPQREYFMFFLLMQPQILLPMSNSIPSSNTEYSANLNKQRFLAPEGDHLCTGKPSHDGTVVPQ